MLMILTCKKNIIRHQYLKEAWLNQCKIPYVFLIGDMSIEDDYLFSDSERHLTIKCSDSYDYLSAKVKLGITTIMKLFKPEYIIKCDDDVYVNVERLYTYISVCLDTGVKYHGKPKTSPKGFGSCWGVNKFKTSKNKVPFIFENDITYSIGPLYYLSAVACEIIIQHMDPEFCKFEDVNVGYTLALQGVTIDKLNDNAFIYSNFVRDFLTGKSLAWHDISHHTFMDLFVQ